MSTLKESISAGVVTGDKVQEIFHYAKSNNFALPAANVVGTNSVNAVLETARDVNSPVVLQFSNGGSVFFAGKGMGNLDQQAAIAGDKAVISEMTDHLEAYLEAVVIIFE